jgi:hypothetical protein
MPLNLFNLLPRSVWNVMALWMPDIISVGKLPLKLNKCFLQFLKKVWKRRVGHQIPITTTTTP